VGDSLVAIAFGVGMLWVFYRAAQMEWPDSYMSVDRSGLQYAIIRCRSVAPVFALNVCQGVPR
jgi:hypothetical protein